MFRNENFNYLTSGESFKAVKNINVFNVKYKCLISVTLIEYKRIVYI